jgi:hypothetical protein
MSFKFNTKPMLQKLIKYLQYRLAMANSWLEQLPNPNEFDDLSPIDDVPNAITRPWNEHWR